jgi:murein DD-endopeptidase MepM/ murein hydrolase activator NlpD
MSGGPFDESSDDSGLRKSKLPDDEVASDALDDNWAEELIVDLDDDDARDAGAAVAGGARATGSTPAYVAHGATGTPAYGMPTAGGGTSTLACPVCSGPVDVKSRHVAVLGGAIRVYCSAQCLAIKDALPPDTGAITLGPAPKRRAWWWLLAPFVVAAGAAAAGAYYMYLRPADDAVVAPTAPALAVTQQAADPQPAIATDPQAEAEAMVMEELTHDAWIHPLAGPTRRMPTNHNGAFGAERGGERPPECVSGHCGVDVGHVWGERVYAVHDGVVDFVNRGPNEEHGGIFVRIAHRNGTLFSWYFHLSVVPRWIRPGEKVTAGQMIGLLGDTGIKHSAPHLHFALSVKTSKHDHERYLDPEPLIAIWPLWIPNEDGTGGRLSTAEPGLPVRETGGRRPATKRAAAAATASEEGAAPPAQTGGGGEPAAASVPPANATTPEPGVASGAATN